MARGLLGTRRLLEKAGTKAPVTESIWTGQGDFGDGKLNPEQVDRFITYMVDQTVMFKDGIRVVRMKADTSELNQLALGTRSLRKASEGETPGLTRVAHSKRNITVVEMVLAVDITFSYLEDNIEGANAEDTIVQLQAMQLANDLEDLSLNGTDADGGTFLKISAGWNAILKDGAGSKFDTDGSTDYRNVVFKGMLAAMPVKFKINKAALRFYVPTNVEEAYRYQIGQRQTPGGDATLQGGGRVSYDGIPVVAVPYMPTGEFLLSPPDNLAFGIHRQISLGQFRNERKRVQEYTWTLRAGFQVVNLDATVIGYNIT